VTFHLSKVYLFVCLRHRRFYGKRQISITRKTLVNKKFLEDILDNSGRIFYHVVIVALSAFVALSLPKIVAFISEKILVYWAIISNEKLFIVSLEMVFGILLILLFNFISRNWQDRRISRIAKMAGLIFVSPAKGFFARRRIKKLKERQGLARDVMFIGATGFRTFVDPKGDLHQVIRNSREAKIMLLHPYSDGASARAKSILDPDITLETYAQQVEKSIDFLKGLKAVQKNVRLKLYHDTPLLKLAVLGDYIWMQHYHAGLNVQKMPEYVFKHDQNTGSLYIPLYQYFLTQWNNPNIAEYDLDSNELIYRNSEGNELRKKFEETVPSSNNLSKVDAGSLPTASVYDTKDEEFPKNERGRRNSMNEDNITSI